MWADGKGNFFESEEIGKQFLSSQSNVLTQSQSSNKGIVGLLKDIEFTELIFVIALILLVAFLSGDAQMFALGALVMYVGILL